MFRWREFPGAIATASSASETASPSLPARRIPSREDAYRHVASRLDGEGVLEEGDVVRRSLPGPRDGRRGQEVRRGDRSGSLLHMPPREAAHRPGQGEVEPDGGT